MFNGGSNFLRITCSGTATITSYSKDDEDEYIVVYGNGAGDYLFITIVEGWFGDLPVFVYFLLVLRPGALDFGDDL